MPSRQPCGPAGFHSSCFFAVFAFPFAVHPFLHLLKWKVCPCQMDVQSDESVSRLYSNWLQRPFVALISVQSKCKSVLPEREHFFSLVPLLLSFAGI